MALITSQTCYAIFLMYWCIDCSILETNCCCCYIRLSLMRNFIGCLHISLNQINRWIEFWHRMTFASPICRFFRILWKLKVDQELETSEAGDQLWYRIEFTYNPLLRCVILAGDRKDSIRKAIYCQQEKIGGENRIKWT